jgi:hypothetical protein
MKYKILSAARAAVPVIEGEEFEEFTGQTYGCVRDDTIIRGIPHIALTDAEGAFFTIPLEDVEEVENDE